MKELHDVAGATCVPVCNQKNGLLMSWGHFIQLVLTTALKNMKIALIVFQRSVPAFKKLHCFHSKVIPLIIFRKTVTIFYENQTQHISKICGRSSKLLNAEVVHIVTTTM
jgi:hypothetical protein